MRRTALYSRSTRPAAGHQAAMAQAGKQYESYWYEANHAFANPTGSRYQEAAATLSWQRTTEFFARHLKR